MENKNFSQNFSNSRWIRNGMSIWPDRILKNFGVKISSLPFDMHYRCELNIKGKRTVYLLSLFQDGFFRVDFLSGSNSEDGHAKISAGVFEECGTDLKISYTNFNYYQMEIQSGLNYEVITRGENNTLIFKNLIFVLEEPVSIPQEVMKVISNNLEIKQLARLEKPIYLGICELTSKAIPTGFEASYHFKDENESKDKYFCYGYEDFYFYKSGIFKSIKDWADMDSEYMSKILGTYTITQSGLDLVFFAYETRRYKVIPFCRKVTLNFNQDGSFKSQNGNVCIKKN